MEKWFGLTPEQVDLLKKLYPAAPDERLRLFVYQAKRAGLDPLTNQIHLLERKRWNKETAQWESSWSIQTGIDGLRAVADRTGLYAPGRVPEIAERGGKIFSATAYVMKRVGEKWFEVPAVAYYDEYVQLDAKGQPQHMWRKMPRNQLSKCAEALALRKAFPVELSGLYAYEEMSSDISSFPPEEPPVSSEPVSFKTETEGVLAQEPRETPGAPEKAATAKPEPYEGQIIISGLPKEGTRGWEVQGFDVLTDQSLTLVGQAIKTLKEGQIVLVKGLRAETGAGIRIKVEEIVSETQPESVAPAPAVETVKVTVTSAPKRGKRSLNGVLKEIAWAFAQTEDGHEVIIVGVDDSLEVIAALTEGRETDVSARQTEENGKTVLYVERVA